MEMTSFAFGMIQTRGFFSCYRASFHIIVSFVSMPENSSRVRPSATHRHSRRVNPRIALLANCNDNNYYLNEEIPESHLQMTRSRSVLNRSVGLSIPRHQNSERPRATLASIPTEESDYDEDDFILLTVIQPRVREARIHHQDAMQISCLEQRKRPKLSKFPGMKHYGAARRGACESGASFSSSSHVLTDIESSGNESSSTSGESSMEVTELRRELLLQKSLKQNAHHHAASPFSSCRRQMPRGSISMDDAAFLLKSSLGIHRKSVSLCGCQTIPNVTRNRKLSKTIKMLCASEGFAVPRMSRPSIQLGSDEFAKVTRRFSKDQVRNVLFYPRGEIAIYRLSNERFFKPDEVADALKDIFKL